MIKIQTYSDYKKLNENQNSVASIESLEKDLKTLTYWTLKQKKSEGHSRILDAICNDRFFIQDLCTLKDGTHKDKSLNFKFVTFVLFLGAKDLSNNNDIKDMSNYYISDKRFPNVIKTIVEEYGDDIYKVTEDSGENKVLKAKHKRKTPIVVCKMDSVYFFYKSDDSIINSLSINGKCYKKTANSQEIEEDNIRKVINENNTSKVFCFDTESYLKGVDVFIQKAKANSIPSEVVVEVACAVEKYKTNDTVAIDSEYRNKIKNKYGF